MSDKTTAADGVPLNGLDRLRALLSLPTAYAQETCSAAADKIERLCETLREIRRDVIESADDTVWMRGGIETVVDRINAALGEEGESGV